jgi:hypothetical protein
MMKPPDDGKRQLYKAGQMVPISGIYFAIHELHRADHEVIAIRGEEFPPCRICRDEVRFCVASPIPHMVHDFDLAGPAPRIALRRAKAAKKGVD